MKAEMHTRTIPLIHRLFRCKRKMKIMNIAVMTNIARPVIDAEIYKKTTIQISDRDKASLTCHFHISFFLSMR